MFTVLYGWNYVDYVTLMKNNYVYFICSSAETCNVVINVSKSIYKNEKKILCGFNICRKVSEGLLWRTKKFWVPVC